MHTHAHSVGWRLHNQELPAVLFLEEAGCEAAHTRRDGAAYRKPKLGNVSQSSQSQLWSYVHLLLRVPGDLGEWSGWEGLGRNELSLERPTKEKENQQPFQLVVTLPQASPVVPHKTV